ncbi:ATP-grasp domain-containing protein [Parvibaculum sp.]|jgi:carbamoyl-phosphate synthase large subunit|uniref:ATP-grasp domain-containing protein n=1 Tax=Parvibaculum sp. TaxID=2024848 RepID=UPI0025D4C070|nr:ATP-grasp domain-containing protein [Parvibaculum sp.]|tara:strand:- start:10489 stop:11493 length:1005 start_codon:yes stop_codon:yes gene_type:complete
MVAGIGGASLGTEIGKCLALAGNYEAFGCDISPTAYGLYDGSFKETFRIDRENYISDVINACHASGAIWLIAGGEQPTALLSAAEAELADHGIALVANSPEIVRLFSDKAETFRKLGAAGFPIPRTRLADGTEAIFAVGLPCIIKPATGSGGSASVFFAVTADEAHIYADFIRRSGGVPIAQEYVGLEEGEFTIGVLSLPDGNLAGSIALKRTLDAKLSLSYRGRGGVISSGYSQGYIGDYCSLRQQAERIAETIGSRGPINIQGRVRDGVLIPFEINPRFSASTYLRALAGFNEIDIMLRFLIGGERPGLLEVKSGWYLRSLTETYVPDEGLK